MKKSLSALSILALLFLGISCGKQNNTPNTPLPDELPPITKTGAGTFGCLLNGKVWLPGGGGQPAMEPQYFKNDFGITAQKSTSTQPKINQSIAMDIKPISDTGLYYIKTKNLYLGVGFVDWITGFSYTYNDKDSLKNWIHITKLDQANLIISGTFNLFFTAPGKDTISITQGRFDARYSY